VTDGDKKADTANRIAAEERTQRLTTEANSRVDTWEREGRLTGNATAEVRKVYVAAVTGQPITPASIEAMINALPKFDTKRISQDAKKQPDNKTPEVPTLEDWVAFDGRRDSAAKAKINNYVQSLVAADKTKTYQGHLAAARQAALANSN